MRSEAIVIHAQGGPDVMQVEAVDVASPGPGQALVEQTAIGINYIDVYQRSGLYKLQMPSQLGMEAAGRVVEVGEGVNLSAGDRVVYAMVLGAYARHRVIDASRLVPIPDGIEDEIAAAVLLKGMTVEYLLCRAYRLGPNDTALFYAASGGVGQLAGQWGRHIGARMIGVTSGEENCRAILDLGYDAAIDRTTDDIAGKVRELTDGKGVNVVYNSVGAASFDASINALAPRGYFFSFGSTTGPVPAVEPTVLQAKGSLYFCRPTLATYVAQEEDLQHSAGEVFRLIKEGVLKVNVGGRWQMADAAAAHTALESGTTRGSQVFTV